MARLARKAEDRQRHTHRPGTRASREAVIKDYVTFSIWVSFPYDAPRPYNICWYIEHLAERGLVSTTISNYISALRTYFGMAGLDRAPLQSQVVANAMRAISLTIRHVPRPAQGADPAIVARALAHSHILDHPRQITLAVTWMFMAFLRQSNLAPRTVAAFDTTRHLTRGDINLRRDHLVIQLKWSKTMQKSQNPTSITLWENRESSLCPVAAFRHLISHQPSLAPTQPLLQFHDGNPMTAPYIAKSWHKLLTAASLQTQGYTLPGLRRGGASFTYHEAGAKLPDVMAHGNWASSAVRSYLTPRQAQTTSVHRALATIRN